MHSLKDWQALKRTFQCLELIGAEPDASHLCVCVFPFCFFFMEVELVCSSVLVSGVQHSDPVLFLPIFQGYYKIYFPVLYSESFCLPIRTMGSTDTNMCAFKNASILPGAQFHPRKNQLILFQHSVPKIPFINIPYRIYHKNKSRKVVYNIMYKNRLELVLSHV